MHSPLRGRWLVLLAPALVLPGCLAPTMIHEEHDASAHMVLRFAVAIRPDASATDIAALETFLTMALHRHGHAHEIDVVDVEDHEAVVTGLQSGIIQAALLPAWAAASAHETAGAKIVLAQAQPLGGEDGRVTTTYRHSEFVVLAESEHQQLADLRNKRVALERPGSAAGHLFPMAHLVNVQLAPPRSFGDSGVPSFFSETHYAGSYLEAWRAVRSGRADVAVVAPDALSAGALEDVRTNGRTLAKQGPVPSPAVVFTHALAPEMLEPLRLTLMELQGEDAQRFRNVCCDDFVQFAPTTTDAHLGSLYVAVAQTGLDYAAVIAPDAQR